MDACSERVPLIRTHAASCFFTGQQNEGQITANQLFLLLKVGVGVGEVGGRLDGGG